MAVYNPYATEYNALFDEQYDAWKRGGEIGSPPVYSPPVYYIPPAPAPSTLEGTNFVVLDDGRVMDADTGDIQGTAQVEAPETYYQTQVTPSPWDLFIKNTFPTSDAAKEVGSVFLPGSPMENAQQLQDFGFSNQQVQEAQAQLDAGMPVTDPQYQESFGFTSDPENPLGFNLIPSGVGEIFAGAGGLILLGVVAWLALRK